MFEFHYSEREIIKLGLLPVSCWLDKVLIQPDKMQYLN